MDKFLIKPKNDEKNMDFDDTHSDISSISDNDNDSDSDYDSIYDANSNYDTENYQP